MILIATASCLFVPRFVQGVKKGHLDALQDATSDRPILAPNYADIMDFLSAVISQAATALKWQHHALY